ncbi:MAG: DUF938 domain-containing protein [Candidatus Thiodiazotropha sp.]|jgi:cyclopropane fatty-acyl-phospholipid synthase-like methyltransferase
MSQIKYESMKPFSEACEENKRPILEQLQRLFRTTRRVLEIGSGTGQHAIYFAAALPNVIWQTSDRIENHAGIQAWLEEAALSNLYEPLDLDVAKSWPEVSFDGVFSANTTHIMSWPEVILLFQGVGRVLQPQGYFALYGPFNYQGQFTSKSNSRFDKWLKARDPLSGLKEFDALNELAELNGMNLEEDIDMPANNRILVWRKL